MRFRGRAALVGLTGVNMKPRVPQIYELLLAVPLGAIGGALCGAVILTFSSLIGSFPGTESESAGYWWYFLGLGAIHGGYVGIVVAPIGYLIFLRRIGLKKAIFPATIGTLVGGGIGAFSSPERALLAGVLGFFLILCGLWFLHKRRSSLNSSD
jgi:hypothetical protein